MRSFLKQSINSIIEIFQPCRFSTACGRLSIISNGARDMKQRYCESIPMISRFAAKSCVSAHLSSKMYYSFFYLYSTIPTAQLFVPNIVTSNNRVPLLTCNIVNPNPRRSFHSSVLEPSLLCYVSPTDTLKDCGYRYTSGRSKDGATKIQDRVTILQSKKKLPIKKRTLSDSEDFEVTAYATASEYNLSALLQGLKELGLYERSCYHAPGLHNTTSSRADPGNFAEPKEEQQTVQGFVTASNQTNDEDDVIPGIEDVLHVIGRYKISPEEREIYFFRDGSVVFWNVLDLERNNVLAYLKSFSVGPVEDHNTVEEQSESFPFSYTEGKTRLTRDRILLSNSGPLHLERYTFSNALALSVKLGLWEAELEQYIDSIENVTEEMNKSGRIILNNKAVVQRMGQLLKMRHSLTLSSDLLDPPDFYWDRKALGQLYEHTSRNLCIAKRTDVMSVKLNHCVELQQLLKDHHADLESHKLERIIIYLIIIEVFFEVLHFVI